MGRSASKLRLLSPRPSSCTLASYSMSISDYQKEILQAMGVALVSLQAAEKLIKLTMTFVLPKSEELTIDL